MNRNTGAGMVYGLGLLGALVFYLEHAVGVEAILIGIVKAILWPAFLVYKLLGL